LRCRLGLGIGAVADVGVGKLVFNEECVVEVQVEVEVEVEVEVKVVAVVEVVVTVGYEDTLECLLFLEVYVNGDCNIELN